MTATRKYNMLCLRMGHSFTAHLLEYEAYRPLYHDLPPCPKCSGEALPITGFNWHLFVKHLIEENHKIRLDIMDLQGEFDEG